MADDDDWQKLSIEEKVSHKVKYFTKYLNL